MAVDCDELEINPFYLALQSQYLDLNERAQEKCYLFCVPLSASLKPGAINMDFAETHILRPSPYFKGQFMTTHSSHSKILCLSDDGQHFNTLQGFSEEIAIKILSEELAYNKEYKQYKILILEQPLDPKFAVCKNQQNTQKGKQLHAHKITGKECKEFLHSFPEMKVALEKLEKDMEYFCRHYMVLPDYLDDAVVRLRDISSNAQKEMLMKLRPPLTSDLRLQEVLAGAIESYLMNAVYHKVFVVICQRFTTQDQVLLSKCHKLSTVHPEQIGVRKVLSCPLPMAVVELANLGSLCTPREKLACLKSTVDNITEGISAFVRRSQSPSLAAISPDVNSEEEAVITTDDLILILVTVIAQARCYHLHSDLFYMENFIWDSADKDRDDLGYCLVSVKAAVQYMMETDFSLLKEMDDLSDKEISLDDLREATTLQATVSLKTRPTDGSVSQKRLDRQLHRVSTILERTVEEMSLQSSHEKQEGLLHSIFSDRVRFPPPDLIPAPKLQDQQNSHLGDFLSALQNDDFDQPFGKQG